MDHSSGELYKCETEQLTGYVNEEEIVKVSVITEEKAKIQHCSRWWM